MLASLATAAIAVACIATSTAAQDAPNIRRVEVIIPYSAGGGTDQLSRQIVEVLKPKLDATFAVRNVPGDAAMLGLSQIARAAPDDPVLAFHNPPNTVLAQIARGQDAIVDIAALTPIAGYGKSFTVLSTYADSPYTTFAELVEAYRSGAERLMGGTDRGGSGELTVALIKEQWGADWQEYVAYDGSGDTMAAVARREIPAGITSLDTALAGMQSGALRPLVVLGAHERQASLPDVPTAVELGLTSLEEIAAPSRIIVGPPDMDPALRDFFVATFEEVLTDPAVVSDFAAQNIEIIYMSPEDVDALVQGAFERLNDLPALERILGKG
jgi:tripartite-type tricarboxylate transporter receptor subunit TctC